MLLYFIYFVYADFDTKTTLNFPRGLKTLNISNSTFSNFYLVVHNAKNVRRLWMTLSRYLDVSCQTDLPVFSGISIFVCS